jgi:hypothetical protein
MEYAKYINENTIEKASKVIFEETVYIANPTEDILLAHGYKPLVDTEQPNVNENEYVIPTYSEEQDRIVTNWVVKQYEEEAEDGEQ